VSHSDSSDIRDEAETYVRDVEDALSTTRELADETRDRIRSKLNDLRHALEEEDDEAVGEQLDDLRSFIDEHADLRRKSALREYAESIGLAILFALFLRGFVVEAFKIPSESMVPTLLVGDHLFVNKFVYGIRIPLTQTFLTRFEEPSKGEVVVFSFPAREARRHMADKPSSRRDCIDVSQLSDSKDFIKRVVGVEGDTIALRDNQLIVNGDPVPRKFLKKEATGEFLYPHEIHEIERLNGHRYTVQYTGGGRDFGPVTVKEDHLFVMGDNRDNSSDSRCWGQVPIEHLKGRAIFIWWSIGSDSIRWQRIGTVIN
jgi:signal peptidase I